MALGIKGDPGLLYLTPAQISLSSKWNADSYVQTTPPALSCSCSPEDMEMFHRFLRMPSHLLHSKWWHPHWVLVLSLLLGEQGS